MERSVYLKKNPMMNSWVMDKYSVALVKLFKNFKRDALIILDNNKELSRELAYDLPDFALRLRMSAQANILTVGEDVTKQYVTIGYKQGVQRSLGGLNKIGIEDTGQMLPSDWRAIDALQVRNLEALRGITAETNKQIIQSLTEGLKNGEGTTRLAERLSNRVDSIGIARAKVMARTETAFAHNQAAEMRYAQNGVERVEWFTSFAEKDWGCRCPELDGQIFNLNDVWERPPIHPRCMCNIAPAGDEIKKQLTPEEWLKSLSTDENAALNIWVRQSYDIRRYQRTGALPPFPPFFGSRLDLKRMPNILRGMETAIKKAPIYKGVSYRGINLEKEALRSLKLQDKIKFDVFTSASKDKATASIFGLGKNERVLFRIKNKTCADISGFNPEEFEVVSLPNKSYRVIDQRIVYVKDKDFVQITMEEL